MATTRLIPMHVIKGQTVAHTVHERLSYAINPEKTNSGQLVKAYGCEPETAAGEMLLCKKEYETYIGRGEEKKSDIVLYQIRQSFKPGEITPEKAQEIGFELAMSFTKGKYQFVVATHTDHAHIHNHIIFNSTSIDHTQKFRNFFGSSEAVRKISDKLCLENGLSIIEKPKQGPSHYGKWLGDKKPLSWQEKLRQIIDAVMAQKPADFDTFLKLMMESGYEVKQGQHLAFKASGQQKFTRLRSLGEGYSEDELRSAILGKTVHAPKAKVPYRKNPDKINLLVDIQAKLQAGKGPGYERWAKVFNLKQMAQTINFLTENNITDYETLVEKTKAATDRYHELSQQIKDLEKRMAEITELKKHIINYAKTKEIYTAYRESGFSGRFYEANAEDILIHQSAKQAFSLLSAKQIPAMKNLQLEYQKCSSAKKSLSADYRSMKNIMKQSVIIKNNVNLIMGASCPEDKKIERVL
ncbi:relaxase/mobilization nuclease domain-containing protein [Sinanaerobacter chloroacetimidivorans]|uniref:Relaxase/mobilization nuclease domain-containing protein n=1 Tax=Sinanaerobacter chloroacetimidivorans TaxID=2818044 RepID=A0A8J8B0Y9_9FIRM|nr:relaxase/mobilization nuclease domain-containing protein [Sinanaerobacter chloroacetimidivorans]MBR0598133.1 relaxase/mobilization nuclease domain-containing protein [Sinanaerobacter chloroacetimidivorans]